MRKLLKDQGITPRVKITDKLGSYDAAKREILPGIEHRSHKSLNNRAGNSHLAVRRGIVNLSVFAEKELHTPGQAAFNSQVMPSQML